MRIVHLVGYFQPEFGYEEYYTARRQAMMGHQVHVVTSDLYFPFNDIGGMLRGMGAKSTSRRRPCGTTEMDGFTVHRLPTLLEMNFDLLVVPGIRSTLESIGPDVVHAHEVRQFMPAMGALNRDLGYALVIDMHGYAASYIEDGGLKDTAVKAEYHLLRTPFSNYAFRRADAMYAVTERSRTFLVEHHGVDPDMIDLVPLGVETEVFHPMPDARRRRRKELGLAGDDVLFTTAGRLDTAKGLERFIKALAGMPRDEGPRWKLLLIGGGHDEYMEKLKALAARLLPDDAAVFLPMQDPKDLAEWYNATDVGFWGKASITIIEAMACRVPVVVPDEDTTGHLISYDNGRGFPLDTPEGRDVEVLARAFGELLNDKKLRRRMGTNSLKGVEKNYDYRVRTKKVLDVYRKALERRGVTKV